MLQNPENSPPNIFRFGDLSYPLFLALILGSIYLMTLLPGVGYSGDTAKFQYVGRVLGTPHTTGYPTYVILNYFFTRFFPLGSVAYRANLLSAVFAVAACIFLYRLLLVFDFHRILAFFCSLSFGLTRTFWSQAVVAEVYTLNLLFVAMVFYFLEKWRRTRADKFILIACFVYAISFGNHLTMITLLPAFVYFVYTNGSYVFRDRKIVISVALFILLGALQYGYLIWRYYSPDVPYLEAQTPNLERFLKVVSGGGFKRKMFVFPLSQIFSVRLAMYGKLLWNELHLMIFFALFGVYGIRNRSLSIFLVLAFVGNLIFALNYNIPDINVFFIPGYFVLFIFGAFGLRFVLNSLLSVRRTGTVLVLSILPIVFLTQNFQQVDQSRNIDEAKEAADVFKLLDDQAVIISTYKHSQYLWYYFLQENPQKKRIYPIRIIDPIAIRDYLDKKSPLYLKEMRKVVPYGLPVYCTTWVQRKTLMQQGFELVRFRRSLYRVQ
jgi:hypothetical protein